MVMSLLIQIFYEEDNEQDNANLRGELYLYLKAQAQAKVAELVEAGHTVTVGDHKWKVIGEVRQTDDPPDYENVGVCGPDLFVETEPGQRISFLKLLHHLWPRNRD